MENLGIQAQTRAVVDRMEHIHVSAADVEKSVAFYRDVFGFEVRYDEEGPYGRCVHTGSDRFYVAITEDPGTAPAQGAEGHATVYHFGFTTPDLDAFRARLAAAGVPVADEADRAESRAIYIHDPDGHEIEVVAYKPGYVYA